MQRMQFVFKMHLIFLNVLSKCVKSVVKTSNELINIHNVQLYLYFGLCKLIL